MTYLQEEYILQNIVLIIPAFLILTAAATEIYERFLKPRIPDELTQRKLRKIAFVTYRFFADEGPKKARKKTAKMLREIYRTDTVNEKYDLIRGL